MTHVHIHTGGVEIDGPEIARLAAAILGKRGPRANNPARKARYAFYWHTAEAALVIALTIAAWREYPALLGALAFLAVIGWAWSLAHLPGRSA